MTEGFAIFPLQRCHFIQQGTHIPVSSLENSGACAMCDT
jgi:hypothetical protein